MNISIICFSMTGLETGERLQRALEKEGESVTLAKKSRYLPDPISVSTSQWAGEQFRTGKEGVIFVGACGIAVRSIAPYIAGKKTDPAVLVIDECGKFVIALLSGHLGGANELALRCAGYLKAVPVVTTATDLHSRFAVDVFAKKNGCAIFHMKAAKEASAALLAGESVGFYSEFPWDGELPEGLVLCGKDGRPSAAADPENVEKAGEVPETGIAVTIHRGCLPFKNTVHVVPPSAVLGMGCRRNKEADVIEKEASVCLADADIYSQAVEKLTSISIKKDEVGLQKLAEDWRIPFITFEEEELSHAEGEFTPSEFVKKITGVNNVCERSAVLGAEQGRLIKNKTGRNGVTTALALRNWEVHFE